MPRENSDHDSQGREPDWRPISDSTDAATAAEVELDAEFILDVAEAAAAEALEL